MEGLAEVKIQLEKNTLKYTDANPAEISNLIKSSYLKFQVSDQEKYKEDNKNQSLGLNLGANKKDSGLEKKQLEKCTFFSYSVFDQQISSLYVVIKFKANTNG